MFDGKTSGGSNLSTVGGILSGLGTIANAGIGIANYYQQAKQMDYERQVQMVSWAREDDAVQRRVRDLQAAGLSPVLAAGSAAGSGPVVQTHAPQMSKVDDMSQAAEVAMRLMTADKQIAQTEQQTKLIEDQQKKTQSDVEVNMYNKARMASEISLNSSRKASQDLDNQLKAIDVKNAQASGVSNDASIPGKIWRDLTGVSMQQVENAYNASNQLIGAAGEVKKKLQPVSQPLSKKQSYFFNEKTKKWEKRK